MKKRIVSVLDIPEPTKKVTNKDIIYNAIKESKGISFIQLTDKINTKSLGNTHHNLKILMSQEKIKKETCKCCGITEQYKIV